MGDAAMEQIYQQIFMTTDMTTDISTDMSRDIPADILTDMSTYITTDMSLDISTDMSTDMPTDIPHAYTKNKYKRCIVLVCRNKKRRLCTDVPFMLRGEYYKELLCSLRELMKMLLAKAPMHIFFK